MGHPTLRVKAEMIKEDEFATPELNSLIEDLIDTMKDKKGIGIAAPQINIAKQVCIIELPEESDRYETKDLPNQRYIVINPKIKVLDGKLQQGNWEGCLSVPGLRGYVRRPQKIQVNFQNETGEKQKLVLDGFLAVVFLHEIDHLKGKLFVDRLSDTSQLIFEDNFQYLFSNS